jgi:hypothetical protein
VSGSPDRVLGLDGRTGLCRRGNGGKVLIIGTMPVIKIIDSPEFDRFVYGWGSIPEVEQDDVTTPTQRACYDLVPLTPIPVDTVNAAIMSLYRRYWNRSFLHP